VEGRSGDDLTGFLDVFEMSVLMIRFKPASNPYTEPSMEVFSWRHSLEKWVELGNLGVLRSEILEVARLDPDISLIE